VYLCISNHFHPQHKLFPWTWLDYIIYSGDHWFSVRYELAFLELNWSSRRCSSDVYCLHHSMKNITFTRRYFRIKYRASYYIRLSVTECQRLNRFSVVKNIRCRILQKASSFVEISSVTFVLLLGHTLFSTSTFTISWPIWMKLGIVIWHFSDRAS